MARNGQPNYLTREDDRDRRDDRRDNRRDDRRDRDRFDSHGRSTQDDHRDDYKDYTSVPNPGYGKYDVADPYHHHALNETIKEHMRKSRRCTDVHCCCFFVMFVLVFMCITQYAWTKGDPRRLYHGFDYEGKLCGADEGVEDKPLNYWPDPDHLDFSICVSECPQDATHQVDYPSEKVIENTDTRTEIVRDTEPKSTYTSKEMAGRFCIPTGGQKSQLADLTRKIIGEEDGGQQGYMALLANMFKDLTNAWSVLLLVLPASCIVCYVYFFMLKACAKVLLLKFFFFLIGAFSVLAFYLLVYVGWNLVRAEEIAGKYSDHPRWITGGLGWFSLLMAIGLQVGLWAVWPSLEKSAQCVAAASQTMWDVQMMLSMPMLEIGVKLLFSLTWMWNFSWVLTNGDVTAAAMVVDGKPIHGMVSKFGYTTLQSCHIVFYILGLIWMNEVITMIFKFLIAYVMAAWYFEPCRDDLSKKEVTPSMWKEGLTNEILYHMGSIALSAMLMSVFCIYRPVEAFLDYVIRTTRKSEHKLLQAFEESCQCCTKCVREVVTCVNKCAVVEMVLRGDQDFFTCARAARTVILNAHKYDHTDVAVLQGLTTVYHIMGVLFTSIIGAVMTYWITSNVSIFTSHTSQYYLESRIGVCFAACVLSFTVSVVFMFTLEMVADSLMFCWLVEGQDDRTHTLYAPRNLRDLIFEDVAPRSERQRSLWDKPDKDRDRDRDRDDRHRGGGWHDDDRSDGGWSSSSHLTKGLSHGHRDRDRDRDGHGWAG